MLGPAAGCPLTTAGERAPSAGTGTSIIDRARKRVIMTIRLALLAIACVSLIGCASPPTAASRTEPEIQLRFTTDEACPAAAVQWPLTFRIDAAADEDVAAVTEDGFRYHVWWSEGFRGGTATEAVVRDPTGEVVARNGEVLTGYVLHGHSVCGTGDSIYVLLAPSP
jgi:hypothetical protein